MPTSVRQRHQPTPIIARPRTTFCTCKYAPDDPTPDLDPIPGLSFRAAPAAAPSAGAVAGLNPRKASTTHVDH